MSLSPFVAKGIQIRKKPRPMYHMDFGFPHKSSFTALCMCLEDCCQDDTKGCICRVCPCQTGRYSHVNHAYSSS